MDYKTRTIRIIGRQQIETAINAIRSLPTGEGLEVVIRKEVKARGLDANGYYWMRLGEIAEQAFFDGKQYDKEVWHEYARRNLLPEIVTLKDGSTRSKWVGVPTGSAMPISTTLLERKCFADYTTAVEAFGASLGVEFSAKEAA